MTTLRDLIDVFWRITEINVTARDPDGVFIHQWIYGENINETMHMYYERMDGKLTIVDERINAHGKPSRNGSEIGWGVEPKYFHKDMLDAPITHMDVGTRQNEKKILYIDIELQRITAMSLPMESKVKE